MISFELVSIFTRLQARETRATAVHQLAVFVSASDVLLFGKDKEIGLFLPAPGLPQTLRQGDRWQVFLKECATARIFRGVVPAPRDGTDVAALGIMCEMGLAILVFIGAEPTEQEQRSISALLPLLGATLAIERTALAADGHAAAARDASRRAGTLNAALDASRRDVQKAYEHAERELVFRREAESKLREADRRKDEFLAMLAHELRNPLAPISTAAQILKLSTVDAARVQQTSQIIDRQVRHMTSLLDELLDVSRVTRGLITLHKEPLDSKSIVADAVEQGRPLIEARRHRLTVQLAHAPARVQADRTRLVQIVTNLLNNAARYTQEGGDILLQLEVEPHQVGIIVRDNGMGIDADLLPHIFELFVQGERSAHRSQGGLGLGLALVSSLVELHGGKVVAHSGGPGMGSEFAVWLPRLTELTTQPDYLHDHANPQVAGKSLRVMVVDDNVDAAQTLATYLEAVGHEVRVAHDANSALDMARSEAPRVLLLDVGLPGMDGYELARRLRSLPEAAKAVLIALTGYGQPDDQERSKSAGFDYHLTKPADASKLARLLAAISSQ